MPDTVLQYQLSAPNGHFALVAVPRPIPGPTEVCIRTKAVALNPLDAKNLLPELLLNHGPSFWAMMQPVLLSLSEMRSSAFQEIVTISSRAVAQKPAHLSFEEVASLPLCYVTAAASIILGLNIPLPHLGFASSNSLRSVLVLGGSSVVGAGAIQLLRQALPDATILTTSSAQHHAHLLSLGATRCFERSVQGDPSTLLAATPNGAGVDAIIDAVGAAASQPAIFSALDPDGPKLYSQVATGATVNVPEDVSVTVIRGPELFARPEGDRLLPGLAELLGSGMYRLPVRVEVVGRGFGAIELGLRRLQGGLSGVKLVVTLK